MNDETPEAPVAEPPKARTYKPCPCGSTPENLMLEIDRNNKIGRVSCSVCGTWGVDFLRGTTVEPEAVMDKAQAAWDAAPRA